MADEQPDVIEILTADHCEVEAMFTELETLLQTRSGTDDQLRKDLVDQDTIELVRHAVAEEVAVYPAVKDKVSGEEAERAKREHAEAERTVKRLENLDLDDATFEDELRNLMTEVRAHVAEEEEQIFPRMREVMTSEELRDLGSRVESIKKMAPTRPHPSVPNDPGKRTGGWFGGGTVRQASRHGDRPRNWTLRPPQVHTAR